MKKDMLVIVALFLVLAGIESVNAYEYVYRPACADPSTISNKPFSITNSWPDGLIYTDPHIPDAVSITNGGYKLCYINNSELFIWYDYGNYTFADGSNKLRRETENVYITDLAGGWTNGFKVGDNYTVSMDYFLPSDSGFCYPLDHTLGYNYLYSKQQVSFNNLGAEYFYGIGGCSAVNLDRCGYEDGEYRLSASELTCDTWHHMDVPITSFIGDYSARDKLGTFGFQATNMYIRNVTLTNPRTQTVRRLY